MDRSTNEGRLGYELRVRLTVFGWLPIVVGLYGLIGFAAYGVYDLLG
jgi:hypothetical protein